MKMVIIVGGMFGSVAAMILALLIATMLHMAVSRSREYLADERGAMYSGNAKGLASALEKLVNFARPSVLMSLFSTHPQMEDRIARLNNLSN